MKKLLFFCFGLLSVTSSIGQISLTFPVERQIFQRNNSNQAYIQISGNFSAEYDSITAKVFPRVVGQGTASAWQKVDERDGKPYFYGKILAQGGWYKLGVKAYKNGVQIDSVGRNRVGVGEVFVIAGQSNATGTTSTSGVGIDSDEDRSNVMRYSNKTNEYNKLPIGYSPMNADSVASDSVYIGPFHNAPWHWGKVSEDLVTALNVPVLFYGAGFGGTRIQLWAESALGQPLTSPDFFIKEEFQHPYGALASVMRLYTSLTGIRAVLWHQGESDSGTPTNDYKGWLQTIVSKTREQSEYPNLSWMVARASYNGSAYGNVIAAQNSVINDDGNVYAGPETDDIIGGSKRSDNVHMDLPAGLSEHATEWYNYITSGFLISSTPILASDFIELDFTCTPGSPSTPITLTSSGSYDKYAWSNRDNTDNEALGNTSDYGADYTALPPSGYKRLNWQYDSTSSITVGTGKYALNVRKATSGKVLFSPIVDLNTFTLPTNPSFVTSASQIRSGDTLTLTGSNCNGIYTWSTGAEINPVALYPTSTANYTLACKTLHCLSAATAAQSVVVSSCFASPLSLTGGVVNTQNPYQTQQTLQSIQKLSPSGKINYSANESVLLNPGFEAKSGAVFKATIENCP
ncbi:3-coathanger stack domain-containing protein [uncultured Arcticibacterium sp.]|uniref:3-coathanger stack domain-containing protein n=1 Tax=uncultured Arcticibacterium sp. TaxID=2173042 RepID=UPI0030FB877E